MVHTESELRYMEAAGFWSVVRERQSYLNVLYLVAAFPLGLFYFILLVVGICLGISTVIVWIGIPILLATIVLWEWCARFERYLVGHLLNMPIRFTDDPRLVGQSWRKLFVGRLRSPVTWTSLIYLILDFPFGILSFTLVITLLAASLSLTFGWLAYLINTLIYRAAGGGYSSSEFFVPITGRIEPGAVAYFLVLCGLGILATVASLHILNGLAHAWGLLARLLLGTRASTLQLAEARAVAAQEHAKAERSEQQRRELIVNVSHELRTPIASIRGHLESLQMAGEELPSGQVAYLEIAHRETERLASLVDDLLALARSDAGELHLDMTAVDAGEVVEEVFQTLAPLARRERQVTLTHSTPQSLPLVLADRERLIQVLLNLVRNAITYTPEGGLVSISLEDAGDTMVALTVADTGIGIPQDELENVFERFYRSDASRARVTGGFGLGLAIVRDLVTAMGGAISAESTEGEGSRFRLLLQVASPREQ
jgi:two-component system, OmpR family, phosphate regulon sensor histidine kinase PhoR